LSPDDLISPEMLPTDRVALGRRAGLSLSTTRQNSILIDDALVAEDMAETSTRLGELVTSATTYPCRTWERPVRLQHAAPVQLGDRVWVTSGSQVCLDGTNLLSQTAGGIPADFRVGFAPTASPAATTSLLASASPRGSAIADASRRSLPRQVGWSSCC